MGNSATGRSAAALMLAAGIVGLAAPRPAEGAFPGENGKLALLSSRDHSAGEIYVMNADGSAQIRLTHNTAADWMPAWSPDGQRLAFATDRDGNFEIYAMNADGSAATNLTGTAAVEHDPSWSPDGQKLAFATDRDGNFEIYAIGADGSAPANLTNAPTFDGDPAWSPDGRRVAFTSDRDGDFEIYVMNADGSGQTNLSNDATGSDTDPVWAPSGLALSFTSNRDGDGEIYGINADGSGRTQLTSNAAGEAEPAWAPDGEKLSFDSDRDGGVDLFVMNADGSGQTNVTHAPPFFDGQSDWQRVTPVLPPGSPPQRFSTAYPPFAQRLTGDEHTVALTLTNGDGSAAAGQRLSHVVDGANPQPPREATTGADGSVLVSWTGASSGTDTLRMFHDVNGNGTRDDGERGALAKVEWSGPVPGESVNVAVEEGVASFKPPRGAAVSAAPGARSAARPRGFIPLTDARQVPVGSIVDVTGGTVRMTAAADLSGGVQTGNFAKGRFRIAQKRARSPITELVLRGGSVRSCRRDLGKRSEAARRQRRRVRRLVGDARGRFRTRGRYGAATVRGTRWVMEDRCRGTLTRVREGSVLVRDFGRGRRITLRAGESYLARPRRR